MSRRHDHSDDSAHQVRPSSSTQLDVGEIESELRVRDRDTIDVTQRPGTSRRTRVDSAPRKSKKSPHLRPRTRDAKVLRTDPNNVPSTSKNTNVNASRKRGNQSRSRSSGRCRNRSQGRPSKKLCDRKNNNRQRRSSSPRKSSRRRKSKSKSNTRSRSSISSSSSAPSVVISYSSRYRVTPCPSRSRSASRASSKTRSLSRSSRSSTRSRVSWKDSRTGSTPCKSRQTSGRQPVDRNHSRSRSDNLRSSASYCRNCGNQIVRHPICQCDCDTPKVRRTKQGGQQDGNYQNCTSGQGHKSSGQRRSNSRGGCAKTRSSRTNNCDSETQGHEKKGGSLMCCLM